MKQISTLTSLLTLLVMMASPALYGQWQNQSHAGLNVFPYGTAMENTKPYITFNGTPMTNTYGFEYSAVSLDLYDGDQLTMSFLYNESNWNIHFIRIWIVDEFESGEEKQIFQGHFQDRNVYARKKVNHQLVHDFQWVTIPDGQLHFTMDINQTSFDGQFRDLEYYTIKVRLSSAHAYQTNRRREKFYRYYVYPAQDDCEDIYSPNCIQGKKLRPGGGNDRVASSTDEGFLLSEGRLNDHEINLWPNPVNEVLQVEYTNTSNPVHLAIYNAAGQQMNVEPRVKAFDNSQYFTIDTQNFVPGVYFLKLNGENGVETLSFSKNP